MEMEQILEILAKLNVKMDANQAKMKADGKGCNEEMMTMLDAHHGRMLAGLGKTEADTEKTEPDPGMMQSIEDHQ
jgi:hypothetical protein